MGEVAADDTYTQDGTVDMKGNPAVKKGTGNWRACPYILGWAYYGMSTNLVNYMESRLGLGNAVAANTVTNWSGTCYITPLIGAFFADAYMGRYWTIASFMIIYILGLTLLTMASSVKGLVPSCTGGTCRPTEAAGRGGVRGAVPDRAGHGRDQAVRVLLRRGPVRRARPGGEEEQELLLQLVLLLHQHRRAGGLVGAGVRADARGLGLGLRHPRRGHGRRRRQLLLRHAAVPAPEARGQPHHARRAGGRRVGPQVERARAGGRRVGAARHPGQGVRHRGQPQAGAHGPVQVPRQGCSGDPRRRLLVRLGVAPVHGDAGGGAQERGASAAHLGERDHVRDRVRADEHHVRAAGQHAGRQHGPPLQHPLGVALHLRHAQRRRLGARLRPPHRARRALRHGPPARVHAAAAHGHRPPRLRLLHARGGGARGGAPARHRAARPVREEGRGPHLHLLAGAAVLHHRRGGDLHLRGPARVLLRPGARRHEEHVHRALAHHQRARELPQHGAGDHRDAHLHQGRQARLDPGQPQPRPPRLLLLPARRAQPHQLRRLPRHRELVQVQEDGGLPGPGCQRGEQDRPLIYDSDFNLCVFLPVSGYG